jgi:hypothetical protein
MRARCWRYRGSRSFRITRSGTATKIDEYAPVMTPISIANAKSFSVSPPNNRSDRIGSTTTSDVFTDRISTWFMDRFATPSYVSFARTVGDSVFSFTLS